MPQVLIERYDSQLEILRSEAANQRELLNLVLGWLIPNTKEKFMAERGRFQFSALSHRVPAAANFLNLLDIKIRSVLADCLRGIFPEDGIEFVVDLLRTVTTGLELESLDHGWEPEKQERILNHFLGLILPEKT